MTDPEEARQFAAETGIDVVAPAVGNMHGLLREMVSGTRISTSMCHALARSSARW